MPIGRIEVSLDPPRVNQRNANQKSKVLIIGVGSTIVPGYQNLNHIDDEVQELEKIFSVQGLEVNVLRDI